MMKKILFLIFSFIFLSSVTWAATALTSSTQIPVVGSTIYVQLNIDYGKEALISEAHYAVTFDADYFMLEDVIWSQSKGEYKSNDGVVYIDKYNDGNDWEYGGQVQLKLLVLEAGVNKISIKENGVARFKDGSVISQTFSGVTISATEASSQTTIGSLSIEGQAISPTFSKNIYNYRLKVPASVTEVNVLTKKGNAKQTITGDGKRILNYGDNRIRVVVKAENGSSSTYEIMVTREDDRTGDVSLRNLVVSETDITYEEGKTTYSATVPKDVSSVFITAQTNDANATLIGTGEKSLAYGLNTFYLNVTSNGGKTQDYVINITRKEQEELLVDSTLFKSFAIDGKEIMISDDVNLLFIGTENDSLDISYKLISNSSSVEITGNENFKIGINEVRVNVSNLKGEKKEYRLLVYKEDGNRFSISSFNDINYYRNKTMVYKAALNDKKNIGKDVLKSLAENDNRLVLDVLNEYGGLIYQVNLNNVESDDIDYSFSVLDEPRLVYETKLPSGCDIWFSVADRFMDGTDIKIYSMDDGGRLNLLTEGVKVINGYISFRTNGSSKYVFSPTSLIKEKNFLQKNWLIIVFGGLVIGLVIYILKTKKKKKKVVVVNDDKPMY